jgi:phenylalanyl-tRNA synthetase beta chain
MKVSLEWLKEFVEIDVPIHELCEILTNVGLEVSDVEETYSDVKNIVICRIEKVEPASDDAKLFICDVFTGKEKLVCLSRAPGLNNGMIAPFALPGALLHDGTKIDTLTLGSRTSYGMLLSEKELGLAHESLNIMNLSDSGSKIGENVVDVLGLKDYIIDIELTANRPDCLSMFGVARDIAVHYHKPLKWKEPDLEPYLIDEKPNIRLSVIEPVLCPYYCGREIINVKIAPSPLWMKKRLTAIGLRPINNIVDITNYVLFETGQPLHAFDSTLLSNSEIIVRLAKDKEKLVLLDDQILELTTKDLVIADGEKPVALAGVMGGKDSQIFETTSKIFLECAVFQPNNIRRTAKRYTLSTDSSYRFERGVDPNNKLQPSKRAAQLMAQLAGGKIIKKKTAIDYLPKEPKKIFVHIDSFERILGSKVDENQILKILTDLEFKVQKIDDNLITMPPSFRPDMDRDVDIIEEVARHVGYEQFTPQLPLMPIKSGKLNRDKLIEEKLKNVLNSCGLFEIKTLSLINEELLQKTLLFDHEHYKNFVKLRNPLTSDQTILRTTLLVNILKCVNHNISHHKRDLAFFEIAPVYILEAEGKYKEPLCISGVILDRSEKKSWRHDKQPLDFYYLKGLIETIFDEFNIKEYSFKNLNLPILRKDESSVVSIFDKAIGNFGRIHPKVAENFDVPDNCYLFELDFEILAKQTEFDVELEELPRYPAITMDVALVVDEGISSDQMKKIIHDNGSEIVDEVILFDLYRGKPLEKGKKSVAFSITYRSKDKTLKHEDVEPIHKKILDSLDEKTDAHLRE